VCQTLQKTKFVIENKKMQKFVKVWEEKEPQKWSTETMRGLAMTPELVGVVTETFNPTIMPIGVTLFYIW